MLTRLPQPNSAHGTFGVAELVSMRLVVGVTRASGEMALHPRGVTRLFEDLQERMTVFQAGTLATVSLATVARAWGLDARQVAWALKQVIGGSLLARGWDAPFRLTSVRVCAEQLRPVPALAASPCSD